MAERPLPSIEELRQAFRYDPGVGKVFRETLTARDRDGYFVGKINGRFVRAHRVAWALAQGEWPDGDIDHINGDRGDNRIANLRVVARAENNKNRALHSNNKSGVHGVSWHRKSNSWQTQIKVNGERHYLGQFPTLEAAAAARKAAEEKFGFHPGHGKAAQ